MAATAKRAFLLDRPEEKTRSHRDKWVVRQGMPLSKRPFAKQRPVVTDLAIHHYYFYFNFPFCWSSNHGDFLPKYGGNWFLQSYTFANRTAEKKEGEGAEQRSSLGSNGKLRNTQQMTRWAKAQIRESVYAGKQQQQHKKVKTILSSK